MHWIKTQNNLLINAEILVRIEMEPLNIKRATLHSNWVIRAYYSHSPHKTSDFQVLMIYPDMNEISNIFDEFIKWLSNPIPPFQVFDFSRWKRPEDMTYTELRNS